MTMPNGKTYYSQRYIYLCPVINAQRQDQPLDMDFYIYLSSQIFNTTRQQSHIEAAPDFYIN